MLATETSQDVNVVLSNCLFIEDKVRYRERSSKRDQQASYLAEWEKDLGCC